MPAFSVGQTHVTTTPYIDVDGLSTGTYVFRLEVEDAAGTASFPMDFTVVVYPPPVVRPTIPRQPVEPIDPIDRESRIPIYKRPGPGGRMEEF